MVEWVLEWVFSVDMGLFLRSIPSSKGSSLYRSRIGLYLCLFLIDA